MSERKTCEYRRGSVAKTAIALMERVIALNSSDTEYYHVKDMAIFGSFVNTDKPTVHDLDIAISLMKTPYYIEQAIKCGKFSESEIERAKSYPIQAPFPEFERYCYMKSPVTENSVLILFSFLFETTMRRIKDSSRILSFHTFRELSYYETPVTIEETLCIVKDGAIDSSATDRIMEIGNIKKGK